MKITRTSRLSGEAHTLDFPSVTTEQLALYMAGAALLQDAFPQLSKGEREFIKSGITSEEWIAFFGEPPAAGPAPDLLLGAGTDQPRSAYVAPAILTLAVPRRGGDDADDRTIAAAVDAAINAGAKVIQEALGVTTGDYAAHWFGGDQVELKLLFSDYLEVQRLAHQQEQAEALRGCVIVDGMAFRYQRNSDGSIFTDGLGARWLECAPLGRTGNVDPDEFGEVQPWYTTEASGEEGKAAREALRQLEGEAIREALRLLREKEGGAR